MKKVIILFACFYVLHAQAHTLEIEYRQATTDDLKSVMQFYGNIDQAGKNNLLVLPESMRKEDLAKNISAGHIFLAINTKNNQIIGAIKLYHPTGIDLKNILEQELNIGNEKFFQSAQILTISSTKIKTEDLPSPDQNQLLPPLDKTCFIYYGRAYIQPEYRGQGVGSTLIAYALKKVTQGLQKKPDYFALLFGLVDANKAHTYMIQPFAQLTKQTILKQIIYTAYKPKIELLDGNMHVSFPEENKGTGNILIAHVGDNHE